MRHFANLSQLNMSVDTHFYPLGSCTMKYNPKRNERVARMPGFADLHPYQPEETLQGMLQLLYEMQEYLQEISGLPACSLQPAAGAHGELTALWVAAAYFRDRGEKRTKVLVPDSAHGTNPASATMAGFETVTVKTLPERHARHGRLPPPARRPDRRVHDHQPEHGRHLRAEDARDRRRRARSAAASCTSTART